MHVGVSKPDIFLYWWSGGWGPQMDSFSSKPSIPHFEFQSYNNFVLWRLGFKPLKQITDGLGRGWGGVTMWDNYLSSIETRKDKPSSVDFAPWNGWLLDAKSECIFPDCSQMKKVGFMPKKQGFLVEECTVCRGNWFSPVLYWPASGDRCRSLILLVWGSAWFSQNPNSQVLHCPERLPSWNCWLLILSLPFMFIWNRIQPPFIIVLIFLSLLFFCVMKEINFFFFPSIIYDGWDGPGICSDKYASA